MLTRLKNSIAYRAKWASLGVYYARRLRFDSIRVAGRKVTLSFPAGEREIQEHEFGCVVFEDCYRLADILHPVRTVLDIGANIGLFAIAARRHFPKATIHCYEPNPCLAVHLRTHCDAIGAAYHMEAVGSQADSVSLRLKTGTLYSISERSDDGAISQIAFAKAVERLGQLDVVKLDCEGAEWDIFADPKPWTKVRSLVMEYHLWARPGSTEEELVTILHNLGFTHVSTLPDPNDNTWGFAFASKDRAVAHEHVGATD